MNSKLQCGKNRISWKMVLSDAWSQSVRDFIKRTAELCVCHQVQAVSRKKKTKTCPQTLSQLAPAPPVPSSSQWPGREGRERKGCFISTSFVLVYTQGTTSDDPREDFQTRPTPDNLLASLSFGDMRLSRTQALLIVAAESLKRGWKLPDLNELLSHWILK